MALPAPALAPTPGSASFGDAAAVVARIQSPSVDEVAVASPTASRSIAPGTREQLEALLRQRKLDRTLTTAIPSMVGADQVAPFGLAPLDARLPGGLPRGHVSELIGPVSSGRTSLAWTWLGAATGRGESAALIDTFDRFDPATGAARSSPALGPGCRKWRRPGSSSR